MAVHPGLTVGRIALLWLNKKVSKSKARSSPRRSQPLLRPAGWRMARHFLIRPHLPRVCLLFLHTRYALLTVAKARVGRMARPRPTFGRDLRVLRRLLPRANLPDRHEPRWERAPA